ncbi:hypothetical protein HY628_02455 [Candidatus Uhrbacteria bacterium]|nr:hypothetical protein [Candidatus Uhrbacteria bacterium]
MSKNKKQNKEEPIFIEETISPNASKEKRHFFLRGKKRKEKRDHLETLTQIYQADGTLPDLTKLEPRRRSRRALLIGLLAFFGVLAAAAWIGFFIFKPYHRFEGKGFTLAAEGPTAPQAGEVVTYEFRYQNTERVEIAQAELRLIIPKEFSVLEFRPRPTGLPSIWTLGSIGQQSAGSISVRGYFKGPAGGRTALQGIATYRPANFNSDFQAITTREALIQGTVLEATLAGPPETGPGEEAAYTYRIKHNGSEALSNLEVRLEATESFLFSSAEPKPMSDRDLRWKIPSLEPGQDFSLALKGHFSAAAKGPTPLSLVVGQAADDDFFLHRSDIVSTDVLASDLSLTIIVNGASRNTTANFGEALRISLSYKNNGSLPLGDVRLSLSAAGTPKGIVDWTRVEQSVSGRFNTDMLTWTRRELGDLETLGEGEEGTIDVVLPIAEVPPAERGADEVRLAASALIATVGGRAANRSLQTTPLRLAVNSDLVFSGQVRYFSPDGTPIGAGPLPPTVGQETKFAAQWKLTNRRHDLTGVTVRAKLPERVSWSGSSTASQGSLSWDPVSRTVSWTVDQFPITSPVLDAQFLVGITPESFDEGTFLTLTGETKIEARDATTGALLSRHLDPLTSEMPTDEKVKGKGVVVNDE